LKIDEQEQADFQISIYIFLKLTCCHNHAFPCPQLNLVINFLNYQNVVPMKILYTLLVSLVFLCSSGITNGNQSHELKEEFFQCADDSECERIRVRGKSMEGI